MSSATRRLAQRNTEYGERIEHQAATIDVLKAMSASPGDPQPVFDLIVRRARELCNAHGAALFEYDGALVHLRTRMATRRHRGRVREAYVAQFPMAPDAWVDRLPGDPGPQIIHIRDMRRGAGHACRSCATSAASRTWRSR